MVTSKDVQNLFKEISVQEHAYAELENGKIVKIYGMFGEKSVKLLYGVIEIKKIKRVFISLNPKRDGSMPKAFKYNQMYCY